MTILFVVDKFEISGVTSVVASLCAHLKLKHTCIVMGGDSDQYPKLVKEFDGCRILPFTIPGTSPAVQQAGTAYTVFRKVLHLAAKDHIDLIVTGTAPSAFGATAAAGLRGITAINWYHGAWDLETASAERFFRSVEESSTPGHPFPLQTPRDIRLPAVSRLKCRFRFMVQSHVMHKSSAIIALSSYATDQIVTHFKIGKSRIVVCSGTVDVPKYAVISHQTAKRQLGIPLEVPVFSLIARPEPRKGIHLAIKAFSNLASRRNALLVIGMPTWNDEYVRYLISGFHTELLGLPLKDARRILSSIIFRNTSVPEEKMRILAASDAFVMSSTELETFGLTTIEALAAGTPVCGFETGATPEILARVGSPSFLARTLSVHGLARAMEDVLDLPPAQALGLRRRCMKVARSFDPANVYPSLDLFLYGIADINRPGSVQTPRHGKISRDIDSGGRGFSQSVAPAPPSPAFGT